MDQRLNEIMDCLENCGIPAELRTERVEPYVNCGNVKRVKNRMQFWAPGNGSGIDAFIGTEMGLWYEKSGSLPYLDSSYRYSYKENRVSFPNTDEAMKFINEVAPDGKAVLEQQLPGQSESVKDNRKQQRKQDDTRMREVPVTENAAKGSHIIKKRRLV